MSSKGTPEPLYAVRAGCILSHLEIWEVGGIQERFHAICWELNESTNYSWREAA